jgi:ferredoxin
VSSVRLIGRIEAGAHVRVQVDREKCVRAENCVVTAPTAFVIDDEGKARIIGPRSIDDDTLWLAAELCPTEAIILESDDGEQLYP